MAAEIQKSITLGIANNFGIQSFAMSLYFDHQHDPNSYFVELQLAKIGGSIQNGRSKSDFIA
jgi:hypothetical protein